MKQKTIEVLRVCALPIKICRHCIFIMYLRVFCVKQALLVNSFQTKLSGQEILKLIVELKEIARSQF